MDRHHGAIGDREDVLAEAIVLLDPAAVAVEDSVVLDSGPVDGEGLGSLDADTSIATRRSVWTLGLQQALVASQPFPFRGGLITMAGWRLMATSGASTSRLPTIKASSESALSVKAIRCVTRSGAVSGGRIR